MPRPRWPREAVGRLRNPGSGLGLAIVEGIAEAHGGAVRVVSEVGKGSTFTLSMPLAVRSRGRPRSAASAHVSAHQAS